MARPYPPTFGAPQQSCGAPLSAVPRYTAGRRASGRTARHAHEAAMHRRWTSMVSAALVALTVLAASRADAQDRSRTKEVVVGLGAQLRTLTAVTIVYWMSTNSLALIHYHLIYRY